MPKKIKTDIINQSIKDEIGKPTAYGFVKDRPIRLEIGKTGDKQYFVSSTILSQEGLSGRKVNFEEFSESKATRNYFLNLVDKHDLKRVSEIDMHEHLYERPKMNFLDSTGYYSRLFTHKGTPPKIKDLKGLENMLQNLDNDYILKKISLPKGEYLLGISSKSNTYILDDISYFDDDEFFEDFWKKVSNYVEPFEFYHSKRKFDLIRLAEMNKQSLIHTICDNGVIKNEVIKINLTSDKSSNNNSDKSE